MKVIQSVLLAASLLSPALISYARPVEPISVFADQAQLIDAAGALAYRADLANKKVEDLSRTSPSNDLNKASRLSRYIRNSAHGMVELLDNQASSDDVLDKLLEIEPLVLQLDSTKRLLLSRYPDDRELKTTLNDVRRTYYYLKQLLTGAI